MSKRNNATPPLALPPMIPLPSVHDLVSRIRVLGDTADACADEHDTAREWMDDQDTALRNLIATMPAATLADAAAQLYVAMGMVDRLEDFEPSEASVAPEATKLRRIIRSVLPVVAEAAGLKMDALAGEYDARRCAGEFPASPAACSGTGRATT
jgi:hypothetical protein